VDHESVSINPPLTSPVSTRALDSRGALGDKVRGALGKVGQAVKICGRARRMYSDTE